MGCGGAGQEVGGVRGGRARGRGGGGTEVRVGEGVSVGAGLVGAREGRTPDAAEMVAWGAERLAAYKCPGEIVFVDSLPRTANGKVTRRELARP
mgnify:CR=1 FL=1